MVEISDLTKKLKLVNGDQQLADNLYLYGDPTYYTVYGIIDPYKNYPGKLQTPGQKKFNKVMAKLQIEI